MSNPTHRGPPGRLYNLLVPDDVKAEIDFALAVGYEKHGRTWAAPEDILGPLTRHLRKYEAGQRIDENDGHRHGAAIAIRAMQLPTKELKDEAGRSS